jgi:eukaryotic-like serine/threonine-protein kinase
VEPETLERFGLTAVRARTRLMTFMHRGAATPAAPPAAALLPRRGGRTAARLGAGAGAALLTLVALADLGPQPTFSPLAAAALVGAAVVLLPRLGWLASAAGLCLWVATQGHQPGTALVLAAGLAVVPVLLPRAGALWSLPALAPLLGVVGLAPMFVGLASLATTTARRAGLAAAGFVWLAVAEVLSGRQLLFGTADGTLVRARWEGSGVHAVSDALVPLVSSPALAPAVVFAAFAAVLPLMVRGRWAGMDLLAASVWAIGLVVALGGLGDLLAATTELDRARGAVAGAALGGLIAVTATLLTPPRPRDVAPDPALP